MKHGGFKNHRSTYQCWQDMKQRCFNKSHKQYKNYGGRGITVCDQWLESFERFFSDMGPKPDGMTLERKDNNAGYSKENCKWASRAEQRANQRGVVLIPVDGEMLPRDVAARRIGMHPATLQMRLRKGWSIEKAITTPVQFQRDHRAAISQGEQP